MDIREFENRLNEWGRQGVPFLFMVDFEMKNPRVFRLDDVDSDELYYDINGITNIHSHGSHGRRTNGIQVEKHPVTFESYKKKFDIVYEHLHYGDTYLTNLTVRTEIKLNVSLTELFHSSHAKYKLLWKNQFLVFSPEIFVLMRDQKIYAYPMKGTIDASRPHAADIIMNDQKELAEHVTIVDLIRNDLSQVAEQVHVSKFRYIDTIRTNEKNLLQVSSEIVGSLREGYKGSIGSILVKLLPAGSVTGAPKNKTLEVIGRAEGEERNYYTGVVGIFDGKNFDSGVMIRYIEQAGDKFYYRSGGGITTQSVSETEYQEVIDKIYVPLT